MASPRHQEGWVHFYSVNVLETYKDAVRLWSGTQGTASSSGGDGCCRELEGSRHPPEGKRAVTHAGKDQLKRREIINRAP